MIQILLVTQFSSLTSVFSVWLYIQLLDHFSTLIMQEPLKIYSVVCSSAA